MTTTGSCHSLGTGRLRATFLLLRSLPNSTGKHLKSFRCGLGNHVELSPLVPNLWLAVQDHGHGGPWGSFLRCRRPHVTSPLLRRPPRHNHKTLVSLQMWAGAHVEWYLLVSNLWIKVRKTHCTRSLMLLWRQHIAFPLIQNKENMCNMCACIVVEHWIIHIESHARDILHFLKWKKNPLKRIFLVKQAPLNALNLRYNLHDYISN